MNTQRTDQARVLKTIQSLSPPEQAALHHLMEARMAALRFGRESWQCALTLNELEHLGTNTTILRSLAFQGLVEHGYENTTADDERRTAMPVKNLLITQQSCFVLTTTGVAVVELLLQQAAGGKGQAVPSFVDYGDHRELRVGGVLVKAFIARAKNQETILRKLQACGWKRWIPNPLPRTKSEKRKLRLRDTIARLNRHQLHGLIRFHGKRLGISWILLC